MIEYLQNLRWKHLKSQATLQFLLFGVRISNVISVRDVVTKLSSAQTNGLWRLNGQIESIEKKEFEITPSLIENQSNDEERALGKLSFMTTRTLNAQVKAEVDQRQCINIFYTRRCVRDKVCSLIVDGGSCANFCEYNLGG